MKEELTEILDHIECLQDPELQSLLSAIKTATDCELVRLQGLITQLQARVAKMTLEDQRHLGYYYLFLGCLYQEINETHKAEQALRKAIPELSASRVNKSVGHWLLGAHYSSQKQYSRARGELQEAAKLLTSHARTQSYREHKHNQRQPAMTNLIEARLKDLFDKNMADETPPDPQRAK